ncbi:fatty acid desaturase [Mastigocoleus testarum]|uniref:Fatty acid desaturase n=1 Tax=Mastigocoleus testarum BC008 TaxID=371196 RepID=A0A0V7ZKA9_9CYAN|nr:fatty acid desaturase [Mastigocoleus testarum]KST63945.1 fatty acid desaturase [Mastigocoleus testarum BC008]KST64655.1 fatty acid desaturase [Mastigocoleus testarum BC008]
MSSYSINLNPPPTNEPSQDGSKLPFTLGDVKAAIPPECFQPNLGKSLFFFGRDILTIGLLYALAYYIDSWWFFPVFWVMQGTMFWALFVVGHDCGHQSFSKSKWLNDFIGHLCHTPILVPYHGWRISHRTHHLNTGHIENDESWYPTTQSYYDEMGIIEKVGRYYVFLLAYPIYLFKRSPGKQGSHFLPSSPLFKDKEKWDVLTSTILWISMIALLGVLTYQWGWMWLLKYYAGPYIVFVMWLDLVTFLHHTEEDVPWYRGEDWTFLKGALSSVDRNYGFISHIHHDIGTHVAHHIFLNMPHYNLKKATAAIKPILGEYYHSSEKTIWRSAWDSCLSCHFVPDAGGKVYYTSPHQSQSSN